MDTRRFAAPEAGQAEPKAPIRESGIDGFRGQRPRDLRDGQ